jgi:hypothetical protein
MPAPVIVPPSGYSNSPQPNVYAHIPSPLPNIDFPRPYWIDKLRNAAIIGCLNPDLAFFEMAIADVAKAAWTTYTPSTKQIIERATGQSWICNTKQVLKTVEEGEQIANSGAGRFVYGLVKGLDIAAYHAFFISTGGQGVLDYVSFAQQFKRKCTNPQSPYRGYTPQGGWAVNVGGPTSPGGSPVYLNAAGSPIAPHLDLGPGEEGVIFQWCSYTSLYETGGIIMRQYIYDEATGSILDDQTVDNWTNTEHHAINYVLTANGEAPGGPTRHISCQTQSLNSLTNRVVCATGGCYVHKWKLGRIGQPPYWNMATQLKAREEGTN